MKSGILRQLIYKHFERARRYVSLSVFVLMILLSFEVNADVISGSDMTVSYSECTGRATVKMRIFHLDCNSCHDDWLEHATYQFRGQNGGWTTFLSDNGYDNDCDPDGSNHITYHGSYGQSYSYDHSIGGNNNCGLGNINNDDDNHINIYFDVPASLLTGNSFSIKMVGSADDDNGTHSISAEKTINLNTPGISSLSASNNNCDYVALSWSTQNFTSCAGNARKTEIYRDDNLINTLTGDATSYNDTGASPGVDYNYKVRPKYTYSNGRVKYGNFSSVVSGKVVNVPEPPINTQADGDCNTAINITWGWNGGNPTDFTIFRNNTPLATVTGTKRNYEDTAVIGGQQYFYTIRANDDCGQGESSESIGATLTAAPISPISLSSQAELGNGIKLGWTVQIDTNQLFTAYELPLTGNTGDDGLDAAWHSNKKYVRIPFYVNLSGNYTFTANWLTSSFDGYMYLYSGEFDPMNNPPATVVDSNDDYGGSNGGGSQFEEILSENTLYHLVLTAYTGENDTPVGDYSLTIGNAPPGGCLLYTSPSPRDLSTSRMPSSA